MIKLFDCNLQYIYKLPSVAWLNQVAEHLPVDRRCRVIAGILRLSQKAKKQFTAKHAEKRKEK